jgi:DNA-directed RNA polymerase specialized sigma24 family protein
MNSPDVAAALYAGAPDAAGRLYDAHAQALFQYCWLTLRSRQHAQTAVCDALVLAGARVAVLSDPGTLRAWLFTMARAEGHRHPLPSLGDTDEPIARPEQPDAVLRIMAWNSVMSLDVVERQALDLNTRHGMTAVEIGLILGLPLPGITGLLATAQDKLERALAAQILVSRDTLECPGRTEAIRGWTGTVTPAFRDRLVEHAARCQVCQPRLPQNVSQGRIFGLLPAPVMDSDTRAHVLTRVGELIRAASAEPEPAPGPAAPALPDPVPADPIVPDPAAPSPVVPDPAASPSAARRPAVKITPSELAVPSADVPEAVEPPAKPAPPAEGKKRRRRGIRVFAGMGAAGAALAVAGGLAYGSLGSSRARLSGSDSRLVPVTASSAQAVTGRPVPQPDASPLILSPRAPAKKSTLVSPATGAGDADAVAGGKQATSGPRDTNRAIVTQGQGTHRTVIVAVKPTASSKPTGGFRTHPAQASARLTMSPASLSLGSGSIGQLTLTASGGSVSWTASTSASGVSLSPASGQPAAGHSTTVTVTVQRQNGGSGSATVQINGAQVPVTWAATATPSAAPSGGYDGSAPAAPPSRWHHRPPSGRITGRGFLLTV